MLIIKPIIICIVSLIIIMLFKRLNPEYMPIVAMICGLILVAYAIPYIKAVIDIINQFDYKLNAINSIIKITVRIIVIALMCEFASQLCSDSGEGYLASKINFVGKIIILSVISPTVISFIEFIIEMINAL